MFRHSTTAALCLTVAALLPAAPSRAAEVDKHLPEDTEIFVEVNFKQLFSSALFQKLGLDFYKELLKENADIQRILDSVGFDPLKDLERILIAGPGGGDSDKGLFILYGRFDRTKLEAKAKELVQKAKKDQNDLVRELVAKGASGDKYTFYELNIPDIETVYVSMLDKGPLLVAPGKDYLIDALEKAAGKKKPGLKNKDLQTVLEKMEGTQTITVAGLGQALSQSSPTDADQIKAIFERTEAISGGVVLANDIKLELKAAAKTEDAARQIKDELVKAADMARMFLNNLVATQKELAPLAAIAKSVKVSAADKIVTIKGEVSAEVLEQALKKD